MKKIILILLIAFTANLNAQSKNYAQVYVVNGVEVYILSEPVRSYEIVYGKGQSINWSSYLTGGLINNSISTKVSKFVKGIVKKAEKEGRQIDAVIYTSGKNVTAIKFTDESTPENKKMATVHKLEGIPTYVLCEPVKDYIVEKNKGGGIKWKSALTAGLINNSIEQDLLKFARKYRKLYKKNKVSALHYTSGKSCNGILFK